MYTFVYCNNVRTSSRPCLITRPPPTSRPRTRAGHRVQGADASAATRHRRLPSPRPLRADSPGSSPHEPGAQPRRVSELGHRPAGTWARSAGRGALRRVLRGGRRLRRDPPSPSPIAATPSRRFPRLITPRAEGSTPAGIELAEGADGPSGSISRTRRPPPRPSRRPTPPRRPAIAVSHRPPPFRTAPTPPTPPARMSPGPVGTTVGDIPHRGWTG
jgi:hypothetical protein